MTFLHTTPLAASTEYTLTLGADVEDLAGNKLGTAKNIKFKTGSGVSTSDVSEFDKGGGTTDDLLTIIANITKAELALDNQDIVTFASYFAPTFNISEEECFFDPNALPVTVQGPSPVGEVCTTTTLNLDEFLGQMKQDLIEQRNMAKGFGEVQRLLLTSVDTGSKMSVEHFNSYFDSNRDAIGEDLYVGWPNRREGVDFVNSEIDVPDPMTPGGTRRESVTYRLKEPCLVEPPGPLDIAGAGEVLTSYRYWNETTKRDEMRIRICSVHDGDADAANSWDEDDELYPADWSGPRNPWDDNDHDCGPGEFDCQNEDGIISFKYMDSDDIPDQAMWYYETFDGINFTIIAEDITSQLGVITVAAAMQFAADSNLDIEGVDNDGDSELVTWENYDGSTSGFIDRRVNEDWPNGTEV